MKDEAEKAEDLRERTTKFAIRIVRLYCTLPKSDPAQVLGKQVLRSGTSVAAHYREAFRARSSADYVNKLQGALQELDETSLWLEPFAECDIVTAGKLRLLMRETDELFAIITAIQKKVKRRISAS
jgi:four helix bundle protein